jgi:hypothetical protein
MKDCKDSSYMTFFVTTLKHNYNLTDQNLCNHKNADSAEI